MNTIFKMAELFADFLSDGDLANKFRFCEVESIWSGSDLVTFDFSGVQGITDSFAHGCFGNLAQSQGASFLQKARLENCSGAVRDTLAVAIARGLEAHKSLVTS
jgi:hypothetical protein